MRTLLKLLPFVAIVVACSPGAQNGNQQELIQKRDSLLNAQLLLSKEINAVNEQIELINPDNGDNISIIKKITAQKNRIASIELKVRELEGKLSKKENDNLISVAVKELKHEPFKHYFQVFGNVKATQGGMISPEMNGRIESIVVVEGQRVNKGDLILTLNTDAVRKQKEAMKSNLEFATQTFEKTKNLWEQKIGSEIQYLQAKSGKESLEAQLEALEAQLRMSQVVAPYSGIVNKILAKKGEMCSPGFPIVEFVNLDRMTVLANISEAYIESVKTGELIDISFNVLDDFTATVPIKRISKVIHPKSRTFEIEVEIDNPQGRVKPNMIASISVNDYEKSDALIIPSLVIRKDISGDYAYVAVDKEGKTFIEKRYIKTGKSYQENTMVTEGLQPGDKVVVKGYNLVSTGIPVKVK